MLDNPTPFVLANNRVTAGNFPTREMRLPTRELELPPGTPSEPGIPREFVKYPGNYPV